MAVIETAHREVAIEAPLRREHGTQAHAPRRRQMAGEQVSEKGPGSGSLDFMLAEVSDLDRADALTYRPHLGGDVLMAAVSVKGRLFVGILTAVREPERVLEPEGRSHDGAARDEPVVQRSGLLPPAHW